MWWKIIVTAVIILARLPTSATIIRQRKIIHSILRRYTCIPKYFCEDNICAHVNKNEAQHLYLLISV